MFKETLIGNAKSALALLGRSGLVKDAYLAGGTAAALLLGHRISIDFDFFTRKEFTPRELATALSKAGAFEEEQASRGTVLGRFEGIRFSCFFYDYPLLGPTRKYQGIEMADLRDIAAMKLDAIGSRGAKRDFIDLYFICQSGYRLPDIFRLYDQKYGRLTSNRVHLEKSLVYFDDGEADEMPKMLKPVSWEEIKSYFVKQISSLATDRNQLGSAPN